MSVPWVPQVITTETGSVYRLDWLARTVARLHVGADSGELRRDGDPLDLHATSELQVGQPWAMLLTGLRDGAYTQRTTSPIAAFRDETTAERITSGMQQLRASPDEIAHTAGISTAQMQQILADQTATDDELARLADTLEVTAPWLARGWHWAQRPLRAELVDWWLARNNVQPEPWPSTLPAIPILPGMTHGQVAGAITGYRQGVVPLDVLAELLARSADEVIDQLNPNRAQDADHDR